MVLAGGAFVLAVARQRDSQLRHVAMGHVEEIRRTLEAFIKERSYLPATLDELPPGRPAIPYPSLDEIRRLREEGGPYVLFAGPFRGMILPRGDGCAAVLYDHGEIRTRWLTGPELREERIRRRALLGER
jgi:hypothetical protein